MGQFFQPTKVRIVGEDLGREPGTVDLPFAIKDLITIFIYSLCDYFRQVQDLIPDQGIGIDQYKTLLRQQFGNR